MVEVGEIVTRAEACTHGPLEALGLGHCPRQGIEGCQTSRLAFEAILRVMSKVPPFYRTEKAIAIPAWEVSGYVSKREKPYCRRHSSYHSLFLLPLLSLLLPHLDCPRSQGKLEFHLYSRCSRGEPVTLY